jgi:hypothetical protein
MGMVEVSDAKSVAPHISVQKGPTRDPLGRAKLKQPRLGENRGLGFRSRWHLYC